jgi:NADPH:quinone reductase-like Zn-dependent oxidoreductase
MKAARLISFGQPVQVKSVPVPRPAPGDVLVRVESAFVPPFMADIVTGAGYTTPPLPFTPGIDAVGHVEQVGEGVRGLGTGHRVYCNPFHQRAGQGPSRSRAFIGSFALGMHSAELLERWRDGAYAEFMLLPQECIIPVPTWLRTDSDALCRLGWLGTAHAALRKAAFASGGTVIVHGATGLVGASAAVVALALGAHCVQVTGRDSGALARLAALDDRISVVPELETARPASALLSCVGGGSAQSLEKLIGRLDLGGRCIVIGAPADALSMAMGRLLRDEITIQGSLWHQAADIEKLFELCRDGKLDLSLFRPSQFALGDVNEALVACRRKGDPLSHVAVAPAAQG